MPTPGRNDRCPCGSGRKFKHCCGSVQATARPAGITPRDREDAELALARFARQHDYGEHVALATILWSGLDTIDVQEAGESFEQHETSMGAFADWFYFDATLERGTTLAQDFLASPQARHLGARALEWITLMQSSCLRPWVVRGVRPDEGLDVEDAWSGERVFVSERAATTQLVPWDILVSRVVARDAHRFEIEGTPFLLPATARKPLVRELKRLRRHHDKGSPGMDDVSFLKRVGVVFHHWWIDLVRERPAPSITTPEGDPVAITRTVFRPAEPGRAIGTLTGATDFFRDDEHGCRWVPSGREGDSIAATITLEGPELVVETMSRPRAERARARVIELLGPMPIVSSEVRGLDDLLAGPRHTPAPDIDLPEGLLELETAKLQAEMDRKWLDTAIPALDGLTPREAARSRRMRSRLQDLLVHIENTAARGTLGHDVSWMWDELKVKRP